MRSYSVMDVRRKKDPIQGETKSKFTHRTNKIYIGGNLNDNWSEIFDGIEK